MFVGSFLCVTNLKNWIGQTVEFLVGIYHSSKLEKGKCLCSVYAKWHSNRFCRHSSDHITQSNSSETQDSQRDFKETTKYLFFMTSNVTHANCCFIKSNFLDFQNAKRNAVAVVWARSPRLLFQIIHRFFSSLFCFARRIFYDFPFRSFAFFTDSRWNFRFAFAVFAKWNATRNCWNWTRSSTSLSFSFLLFSSRIVRREWRYLDSCETNFALQQRTWIMRLHLKNSKLYVRIFSSSARGQRAITHFNAIVLIRCLPIYFPIHGRLSKRIILSIAAVIVVRSFDWMKL